MQDVHAVTGAELYHLENRHEKGYQDEDPGTVMVMGVPALTCDWELGAAMVRAVLGSR